MVVTLNPEEIVLNVRPGLAERATDASAEEQLASRHSISGR
jgi:hypothetical protein